MTEKPPAVKTAGLTLLTLKLSPQLKSDSPRTGASTSWFGMPPPY